MGGFIILTALLVSTLLWTNLHNRYVWVLIVATASFAMIGFLDDYRKLRTKKGIPAKQKFGGADPRRGRPHDLALPLAARRLHHRAVHSLLQGHGWSRWAGSGSPSRCW